MKITTSNGLTVQPLILFEIAFNEKKKKKRKERKQLKNPVNIESRRLGLKCFVYLIRMQTGSEMLKGKGDGNNDRGNVYAEVALGWKISVQRPV